MDIKYLYENYIKGRKVITDTREIKEGDIFIALKGDNFNGNQFATDAIEKGAYAAFVDSNEIQHKKCIYVEDGLQFLQKVASYHRQILNVPILAITGTNGKTTTKELCNAVISEKYKTFATEGNYNNHIGVPLTLLNMDETTEFGIVEMGANHPGEIKELCEIAAPNYGLITNIGYAHLEGFGSYENIIKTKKELYDYICLKQGTLFVNSDDTLLMEISKGQNRILYGSEEGIIKGEIKQSVPYLVFSLKTLRGDLYVKTRLTGGYNFTNALAASCIGIYFDIPVESIRDSLESYTPSNLRSQLIKTGRNIIILDAYNANPSSMQSSLKEFKEISYPSKIVILGEMLELGNESKQAHENLIQTVLEGNFSQIFLVGKEFEYVNNNYNFINYFRNTEELIHYLKDSKNKLQDSYVFIKGSRGNKLERIVEYL